MKSSIFSKLPKQQRQAYIDNKKEALKVLWSQKNRHEIVKKALQIKKVTGVKLPHLPNIKTGKLINMIVVYSLRDYLS